MAKEMNAGGAQISKQTLVAMKTSDALSTDDLGSTASSPKVDVIIPVYNEHENIGPAIREIVNSLTIPYNLNLVYDFDEDSTLPAAKKAAEELGISINLVKNRYGRGALNAIKTGLHACTAEYLVVTMADLSDPASVINNMYYFAESGGYDVVCGSRYMRGGRQNGGPILKRTLSRLAGMSIYFLSGLPTHDVTNSFKLYRRSLIDNTTIESSGGFELGMELVVKAHFGGYKVGEVPTTWNDRSQGQSRFQLFRWLPKYLRWYFFALQHRMLRLVGIK